MMTEMRSDEIQAEIQALRKQNRILIKKLERSEADRRQLEDASDQREKLLKGVIRDLEHSKLELENRSRELEEALGKLKTLQMRLIESEKMSSLRILVAGIAHEINNPINFVYGNLSCVKTYTTDLLDLVQAYQQLIPHPPEVLRQKVEEIDLSFLAEDLPSLIHSMQAGTRRVREIVLALRNFARLDEAEFKPANLHDGIENTLLILHHRLEKSADRPAIQVIKEYGDLPKIECYPGQLNQVFLHLINNAIDALEEKEQKRHFLASKGELPLDQKPFAETQSDENRIWIRTEVYNRNRIRITIADNGIGIPEQVRSRLFDPFFTTKPVGKGTGLGLALSYQIVREKHGGRLWYESTPAAGTQFVVEIPIHQLEHPEPLNSP